MEIKIGEIIKEHQPELHAKLKKKKKHKKRLRKEKLSFKDVQELMGHSSYKRSRYGIRQVRHG